MAPLLDRFRAHLARTRLFSEPGGAIVAVSGGGDSLVLLDLMHQVAAEWRLSLTVAHADHGIQAVSRSVGQAVRELAEQYELPFELGELELGPDTSETVARRARYRWLREVQQRGGARYLVTAHHQDDQTETVLLRVLRGSGLAGLAGIPGRGRGGLVRPLLPFAKADLAEYAAARGLAVYDDPANRDPRHARSWVRTELLPLLGERFGPGVAADVLRLGRHAAWDRRAWDHALELVPELSLRAHGGGFDVARGVLARYDPALAAALLAAAARRAGLVLGPGKARQMAAFAAKPSGRRMQLPGGWTAETAFERLRVFREAGPAPQAVVGAGAPGRAVFGEFVVHMGDGASAAHARAGGLDHLDRTRWLGVAFLSRG